MRAGTLEPLPPPPLPGRLAAMRGPSSESHNFYLLVKNGFRYQSREHKRIIVKLAP